MMEKADMAKYRVCGYYRGTVRKTVWKLYVVMIWEMVKTVEVR